MLKKDIKKLTSGSKLILLLLEGSYYAGRLQDMTKLSRALYPEFEASRARQRLNSLSFKLKQKGWIQYEYKESKKIFKLTNKGQLEALFAKISTEERPANWDNKWRLIIFDIPEKARHIRDKLRRLLKRFGFKALQASVYVSPYPLKSAGIEYLNQSQLLSYIRILRVDRVDNPADLIKAFHLKLRRVSKK